MWSKLKQNLIIYSSTDTHYTGISIVQYLVPFLAVASSLFEASCFWPVSMGTTYSAVKVSMLLRQPGWTLQEWRAWSQSSIQVNLKHCSWVPYLVVVYVSKNLILFLLKFKLNMKHLYMYELSALTSPICPIDHQSYCCKKLLVCDFFM